MRHTDRRFGRATVGLRLITRQLNTDRAVVLTMVVAVLVSGLFLSAGPLLFDRLAEDALDDAISAPPPQLRNIAVSLTSFIGASRTDDPFQNVWRRGENFRERQMPESVQAIIQSEVGLADSPRFLMEGMPGDGRDPRFPSFIRLRYQQDIDRHVSLLAGRMPAPAESILVELGEDCPLTGEEERTEELDCAEVSVPLFEVAVTQETLDQLPITIGEEMLLTPDSCKARPCGGLGNAIADDGAYFGLPANTLQYRLALRIAGVIAIEEPANDYWYGDLRLHRPRIISNADVTLVYTTGLMTPEDYQAALARTGAAHWTYSWRHFVDPERVGPDTIDQLTADLSTLQNDFPAASFRGASHMEVHTKLTEFLDAFSDQREVAVGMLSMSVAGVFAVAVGLVLVLAALVTERQRDGLVLLRNRGASRSQLLASRALQGVILTVPPAALAHYLAMTLVPEPAVASVGVSIALVATATVFIVIAAGSVTFRDLGSLQGRRDRDAGASSGRWVFEGLIAALAAGAVVILRRRGSVVSGDASFDALAAAAPVLVSLAVAVGALRLYPYAIRSLAWVGSKLRGPVVFVGFRRVLQQPPVARLPLIVMLLSVVVATFSWVVRYSITDGQRQATWHETGAAYRLSEANPANPLSGSPDLGALASVEATAVGFRMPFARTSSEIGSAPATVDALFVDAAALAAVNADTPADPHFPGFMTDVAADHAGTRDDPIPVIASKRWSAVAASAGDVFSVALGRVTVFLEVQEVREAFPGMPADRAFIVGNARPLERLDPLTVARPTVMYVRAGPAALDELADAVSRGSLATILSSQAASLSEIHNAPFSTGVDRGLRMTTWLTTVFGAVTAVSSLALGSSTRRRDFGYLRTQGLASRQAVWLTVIEQAPAISVAAVVGGLLGVGIAFVLRPVINLKAFTGGGIDVGFVIDAGPIALLTAGLVAALSLAAGIFAWINRESDLSGLLRIGDE